MGLDRTELEVFVRLRAEGETSALEIIEELKEIRKQLKDLQEQARETNDTLNQIAASSAATAVSMRAFAAANKDAAVATKDATQSNDSNNQSLWQTITSLPIIGGLITNVVGVLTGLAVALGIAAGISLFFGDVLVQFAGWIILTTTYLLGMTAALTEFAVGLIAVGTLLAMGAVLLGGMGVAAVLLSERLFTLGKISVDPLAGLVASLGKMADAWGKQALPITHQITQFLQGLIPDVQRAGSTLLSWFGGQLPAILKIASSAFDSLKGAAKQLWEIIQPVLDRMISQSPMWEKFFSMILNLGVQALGWLVNALMSVAVWFSDMPGLLPLVQSIFKGIGDAATGLATNFDAFVKWFLERLPALTPIAKGVMGSLGDAIQNIGHVAGQVVDWLIKNWPEISKSAKQTWNDIQNGWNAIAPTLSQLVPQVIKVISDAFNTLHKNGQLVHDVLFTLAVVIAIVVIAILVIIAVVAKVIDLIGQLWTWIHNVINAFMNWWSNMDRTNSKFHDVISVIGDVLSAIGSLVSAISRPFDLSAWGTLWSAINKVAVEIGIVLDDLAKIPHGGGGGGGTGSGGGGGGGGNPMISPFAIQTGPPVVGAFSPGTALGANGFQQQINIFLDGQQIAGFINQTAMAKLTATMTLT